MSDPDFKMRDTMYGKKEFISDAKHYIYTDANNNSLCITRYGDRKRPPTYYDVASFTIIQSGNSNAKVCMLVYHSGQWNGVNIVNKNLVHYDSSNDIWTITDMTGANPVILQYNSSPNAVINILP